MPSSKPKLLSKPSAPGAARRVTSVLASTTFTTLMFLTSHAAAQPCTAESSPTVKARVIELYTSQGCSSCPPADRWLRGIAAQPASHAVVPLSLHVKYWDYIGWKDPYAREEFTARQRWLAQLNRNNTVYTPGVFLDGGEWAQWSSSASQQAKLQGAATAPQASIQIQVNRSAGEVAASVSAQVLPSVLKPKGSDTGVQTSTPTGAQKAAAPRLALFVALTQSGIGNAVNAGENRGEHLLHDHVVRTWSGPLALNATGTVQHSMVLPSEVTVVAGAGGTTNTHRYGLSALVQDLDSGHVLQAMRMDLRSCLKG
jgi:hypothetical protein